MIQDLQDRLSQLRMEGVTRAADYTPGSEDVVLQQCASDIFLFLS